MQIAVAVVYCGIAGGARAGDEAPDALQRAALTAPAHGDAATWVDLAPGRRGSEPFPGEPRIGMPDPAPAFGATGAAARHRWLVPALECVGYNVALWGFDRYALDASFSHVGAASIAANLRGGWSLDTDDFSTNAFLHPYAGTVYFSAARTSGFDFWTAGAFAFGGSLWWKIAGSAGGPGTRACHSRLVRWSR